jgi:glucose-1-phosphate thymidylyltransferase
MKVIIPLAGKGTRLRPHTYITPKPMMKVAGKPVMSYVLDELKKLGNVEEIVYITGHLREKVEEYARRDGRAVCIHRAEGPGRDGGGDRAGARLRRPAVLIIFVDTIFDADLSR